MRSEKITTRVVDFGPDADLLQLLDERGELGGAVVGRPPRRSSASVSRASSSACWSGSASSPSPVAQRACGGCSTVSASAWWRGQRRLEQRPREQAGALARRSARDRRRGGSRCRRARRTRRPRPASGVTGIGRGRQAVGPRRPDLGRDLLVGLVAADVEVLDVARGWMFLGSAMAVGSSRRMSSAKLSGSPLCGVALT